MSKRATTLEMSDKEYNAIMLKVPAFTLEELVPQLTNEGFRFCLYKGNPLNAPIDKIGVYSSPIMMWDNID